MKLTYIFKILIIFFRSDMVRFRACILPIRRNRWRIHILVLKAVLGRIRLPLLAQHALLAWALALVSYRLFLETFSSSSDRAFLNNFWFKIDIFFVRNGHPALQLWLSICIVISESDLRIHLFILSLSSWSTVSNLLGLRFTQRSCLIFRLKRRLTHLTRYLFLELILISIWISFLLNSIDY